MKKQKILAAVFGWLLIAGCATEQGNYWDMRSVYEFDDLNINFRADDFVFTRVGAERNQSREGWIESGTWQADIEGGKATVWVYIATLYDKAFKKDGVRKMRDVARSVSGDSYLEFGGEGSVSSNSGDIDYIFYRASGQPCVVIRKYWNDPRLSADVLRAVALEWVAGTHLLNAYHCRDSGADLEMEDLQLLFDGITATELVWPRDMFISSDETF